MSLLSLGKDINDAKNIAKSLKNLRMGDLFEIPLDDTVERKIINEEKKRYSSKND
jgi:2-isopropylmalate synthase